MDYYRADEIGKRSLSNLIQDNWARNQSVGKGIKNAMSDKMKAFGTRVKKNFTGMNMIKKLTGSDLLTSLYGKVTGKSKEDIAYFTGRKKPKTRRMGNIMSLPDSEGGLSGKTASLLESMFNFMIKTETDKQKRAQTERSFREERDNEEEQRHQQFLKALRMFTGIGAATKVEEKKSGGLLDMIKGLWDSFIAPFKWALDWVLANKTMLMSIVRFLGPLGATVLAAGAIVWLGEQLKEYFRNNVPNMNVITPTEAAAALRNGDQKQIDKLGGEAKLRDIITNAPKRATEIMARGDNREILAAGGLAKLKEIEKDIVAPPPKRDAMQDLSPTVTPREQFIKQGRRTKIANAAKWDKEFGPYYDPNTGKRLEQPKTPEAATPTVPAKSATPVQSAPPAPAQPASAPTAAPVSSVPPLGKINDVVSENNTLNLEQATGPVGDTKPIVMQNTNSKHLKDSPISATATTRDETPILEHVRRASASPI